jgi:hypothetical protein
MAVAFFRPGRFPDKIVNCAIQRAEFHSEKRLFPDRNNSHQNKLGARPELAGEFGCLFPIFASHSAWHRLIRKQ